MTSQGQWVENCGQSLGMNLKKNKNLIATENESVQDKLNNQKVENADFILISISSGSKSHEEHKY